MKYEEDDTVVFTLKKGCLGIGIVTHTYEQDAEEEDSDAENDYEKLKPGQLNVEWYPRGHETTVYGDAVGFWKFAYTFGFLVIGI